jgi:predicted outer membrane repeat protein
LAANGDTIEFAATLSGGQVIPLSSTLNVNQSNLTITDAGSAPVTISGNGTIQVFNVNGTGAAIDFLTITGGSAEYGGGIGLNAGLSLELSECSLTNNTSGSAGGAIGTSLNDNLTVINCSFINNSYDASAIYVSPGDQLTVIGSTFIRNSSSAIVNNQGNVTVTNCTFTNNNGGLGAALNNGGSMTVGSCTFTNNTCYAGGAIFDATGTLAVTGSTFSGNSAQTDGGAVYCDAGANLSLTNCTFVGNSASGGGGAIDLVWGPDNLTNVTITGNRATSGFGGGLLVGGSTGGVTLINTIVAGNFDGASPSTTPDDISGGIDVATSFNNLIGAGGGGGLPTAFQGNQVGVTNAGLDPNGLQNNGGPTQTIALLPTSPAIDAGDASLAPSTDQRGYPRPDPGVPEPDIGAFEGSSFFDNFNRADSPSLGFDWQIPPLAAALQFTYRRPPLATALRFTYRRQAEFGFQLQSDTAVSLSTSFNAAQVTGQVLLNPTLQADVNASNPQVLAVGLLARIQSTYEAYAAVLTNTGTAEILLVDGVSKTFTVLGSALAGTKVATLTFTVTGTGTGTTLSLFLNGSSTALVTVTNSAQTTLDRAGGVGIFGWGPNGVIDNFSASGP